MKKRVRRRNKRVGMLNARRRLTARRGRGVELLEDEVAMIRGEIKEARKVLKRFLKGLERERWRGVIKECEERVRGRIGDMYKCLRRLGTRERPAQRSMKLTVDEFKNHFESVSRDRYEERPEVIERTVKGAVDLRNDSRAKEGNECLNVEPESEEIREAVKEKRESAPGLGGVRIGYIRKACESIQGRVIEIVQRMFEVRVNEWDVLVKVGAMLWVPGHCGLVGNELADEEARREAEFPSRMCCWTEARRGRSSERV